MKFKIILLCCWILCGKLGAQIPIFTASQHLVGNGDLVTVDIQVTNFDTIGTFQFSMTWDHTVLQYQNTSNHAISTYTGSNFGEGGVNEGVLTTLWFSPSLEPITLADQSILFSVNFEVLGMEGDVSLFEFTDMPTDIFVATLSGTSIDEIEATFEMGTVEVISTQLLIEGQTTDILCFDENNGSIDINILGGLPPYQIDWSGPNNFTSDQTNLTNLLPGIYTVNIIDDFGTTATETFEIAAPASALFIEEIISQQSNCNATTGSIEVMISGGTPPYSYDFGNGFTTNATVENLMAGEYPIAILDGNNCAISGMTIIDQALPEMISLGQDTSICENEQLILNPGEFNGIAQWFQDGNLVMNPNNTLEIFETGTYAIEVINESGCVSSDTIEVILKELDISISPDTMIFRGMDVQLFVEGGTDYFWEPGEFLSCQTCPDPIAQPIRDTYFYVEISTPNGCFATDSVFVDISNDLELVIDPINFISPNGDGKNDRLVFEGLEMFPQNSLIIYSRWGNKIYNAVNYQLNGNFWDGTIDGKELPAGVYFYILKVDANGTEIRSSLTLTR